MESSREANAEGHDAWFMESSCAVKTEGHVHVPQTSLRSQSVFDALIQEVIQEHTRQTHSLKLDIARLQGLLCSRDGEVQDPAAQAAQGDEHGVDSNWLAADNPKQDDGTESESSGPRPSRRVSTSSGKWLSRQDSNLNPSHFEMSCTLPSEPRLSERMVGAVSTHFGCVPTSFAVKLVRLIEWLGSIEEPKRSGRCYRLIHSVPCHIFIAAIIILNSLFIIRMADMDMKSSLGCAEYNLEYIGNMHVQEAELCFTCCYAVEWTLRVYAHGSYFWVNKDRWWNLMDTGLLLLACYELRTITGYSTHHLDVNLTYMRLLRLLKVVRGLKLMRQFRFVREMRLMLDCIFHSATQLLLCTVLVLYFLCMFAVIFVQLLAEFLADNEKEVSDTTRQSMKEYFGSVSETMVSLYMAITGGSDWEVQYAVFYDAGAGVTLLYLLFISFFAVVVWNIVLSTFVEKALQLAVPDLDTMMADKHFRDARDAKEMCKMISEMTDDNHDGLINVDEFASHMEDPCFQDFLHIRGFDVKNASSFFDMLKSMNDHEDTVDVETFVACCLRLQGVATSIDLQTLRFEMKTMYYKQKGNMAKLEDLVSEMADNLVTAQARAQPTYEKQLRGPGFSAQVPGSITPKLTPQFVVGTPRT